MKLLVAILLCLLPFAIVGAVMFVEYRRSKSLRDFHGRAIAEYRRSIEEAKK